MSTTRKERIIRQKQSMKALVQAIDPKPAKRVKYVFSNGRKFKVKYDG